MITLALKKGPFSGPFFILEVFEILLMLAEITLLYVFLSALEGHKKNGYSGYCSLADRMDRVYEKD